MTSIRIFINFCLLTIFSTFAVPINYPLIPTLQFKYGYAGNAKPALNSVNGNFEQSSANKDDLLMKGVKHLLMELGLESQKDQREFEHWERMVRLPRCSNDTRTRRQKRFVAHRKRWQFTDLKWRLSDPYRLLKTRADFDVVHHVLAQALDMWAQGSGRVLRINDVSSLSEVADIDIHFAIGRHDDQEAFDGPGGIVAHSGYPMEGKVHFDAAELWTVGGKKGLDLRLVTLHELGHALGLRHSEFNDSVMYPVYARQSQGLGLSEDDVRGIRALYAPSNARVTDGTSRDHKTTAAPTVRLYELADTQSKLSRFLKPRKRRLELPVH